LFQEKIPWYAYLTFGQNFWMAKLNSMGSEQIDVTWSLAVEEQFYLTLPIIIRCLSRRRLPFVLSVGVVFAPLVRVAVWFAADSVHRAHAVYLLAPCRMDALLLGVLAAHAVRNTPWRDWLFAHEGLIGTVSMLSAVGILEMIHMKVSGDSLAFVLFAYTLNAWFYLSLLLLAMRQRGLVSRLFSFRPLTEIGIVAYGLYLFHQPVLGLVYGLAGKTSPMLHDLPTTGLTLLSGCLVFTLVRLSWLYLEKPLINRGYRYQYRQKPVYNTVTVQAMQRL
jgi:peptidoglycan/LPS O-acetylase OafA/YrhL